MDLVAGGARPALRSRRRTTESPLRLLINAQTGAEHVSYLRRHLRRACRLLDTAMRELSVALVDDQAMAQMHERFLGISGPTDVLSFEIDHDARGRVVSGEIIVCVAEARRRAGRSKPAMRRELLLYALHGVLHLCGYDDRTASGFEMMHRMEDEILTRLGVGPVFAAFPRRRAEAKGK